MKLAEYVSYDATALAALVRKGEVTGAELTACANAAIDAVNDRLNFVAARLPEPVMGNASGPLAGVPFVVKDLVMHLSGVPQRMGTRLLAAGQYVPAQNSTLFDRFQQAGLNTVAVTTTPEFGYNATAEALLYGPTRNPWDLTRSTGGSSGGSAAAVAAGVVPVAHANDGGGSIRIPAASCGLVGLKPTRGRTPVGPDYGFPLFGMGIEFALSRTVRDTALLLDCVEGPEVGALFDIPRPAQPYAASLTQPTRKLKIALATHLSGRPEADPEIVACLMEVAALLRAQGHTVIEASPAYDDAAWKRAAFVAWNGFINAGVTGLAQALGTTPTSETFEAVTLACAAAGARLTASDYETAFMQVNMICRALGHFMLDYDVFMLPTLRHLPLPLGYLDQNADMDAAQWFDHLFNAVPYTALFNMTGQPAISVPVFSASGLPSAVQFVAPMGDEATLLQLARDIEDAKPWISRRPAVFAV